VPIPWNDDPPGSAPTIVANLQRVGTTIVAEAGLRRAPTVAMAQAWHRQTYTGVALPVGYYAGEVRDSDPRFPELIGYEVRIGAAQGALSASVPAELVSFERGAQAVIARLDGILPSGLAPGTIAELQGVLQAAALLHGDWIRIHPFANGNGRTARLWANWVVVRYGLPFFVALRPRPAGIIYAAAASSSMRGDHRAMATAFYDMLRSRLANP